LGEAVLTWQDIRGLANCELWDGTRLTAPHRDWTDPVAFPLIDPPAQPICYTREPWLVGKDPALLASLRGGVLVSSFYDPPLTQTRVDAVMAAGIRHWFAVQVHAVHPSVTPMPLGIDRRDVGKMAESVRLPWAQRDILLYVNMSPRFASRRKLLAQFADQQTWARIEGGLSMREFFADVGRSRFVLSPPGRAWDCYRTYEALAMGAVPIVLRCEPVSRVVEGLPVLMVDDWREVTRERLERYEPPATWNLETMTKAYWTKRIQEMAGG
jgi:hypothetical protein